MRSNFDFANTYSKSKLDLFKTCKKAYHFSYIDEVVSPHKWKFKKARDFKTLGQAVHNTITLFYYLDPEKRSYDELKNLLKICWRSETMPRKKMPLGEYGGFESIEHERAKYGEALKILKNFYDTDKLTQKPFYIPTNDLEHSINDYFEWVIPLSRPPLKLSGKIDRIDETDNSNLLVIDFKTGSKKSSDNFQLKLYKFLAEKRFGKNVEKTSFYWLKESIIEDFILTDESLDKIEKEILKRIDEILTETKFEPHVSKLCKFCDFLSICPANEEARKIIGEAKDLDYSDDLPF